jgi:hypothetical protein
MVDNFDLIDGGSKIWSGAKTGKWFYMKETAFQYSSKNCKKLDVRVELPNSYNSMNFPFNAFCDPKYPNNECKDWMCKSMLDSFFPHFKVTYDPQLENVTELETHFESASIFDKTMYLKY